MKKIILLALSICTLGILSCEKKDSKDSKEIKQSFKIVINNMVGEQEINLNADTFVSILGDSFMITNYKYYISNLRLIKSDGGEFPIPESYYLINEEEQESKQLELKNIPLGNYTGIKMLLGVDSLRNVSGAQTGALDPIHGMFWTWNSGYIMAKLEAKSPQSGNPFSGVMLHLGGFSGNLSSLRETQLTFPQQMIIDGNNTPTITMKSDINKWLSGSYDIRFSQIYNVMDPSATSAKIADNYQHHLSVTSINN